MVTEPRSWGVDLVEQASTLDERLHGPFVPDPHAPDHALGDTRLARWRTLVADDDDDRFNRRLAREVLDPPTIRSLLGAVRLAADSPLPDWIHLLGDVSAAAQRAAAGDTDGELPAPALDRALSADAPAPFEDVLLPFIRVARVRVSLRGAGGTTLLAAEAHAAFERALLHRLSSLAAVALVTELAGRRSAAQARRPSLGISGGAPSRRHYDEYASALHADGFAGLWQRYPMLARLLATRTLFWIDATCELLDRLRRDHRDIEATFSPGAALGIVTRAEAHLSDSHASGRSVAVLHFSNGVRVVYKPRSLGLERAFSSLLTWLNDGRVAPSLRALTVVDRHTHGWVEHASYAPCVDADGARHYFERGGMLLSLAYALGGGDLHSGNVIACGEHPVIIDLEVFMASLIRTGAAEAKSRRGTEHRHGYWNSVLRTGLLPARALRSNGTSYVEGGLAGSLTEHPIRRLVWKHVNTDLMSRVEEDAVARLQARGAHVGDVSCVPTDFTDEIIAGFRRMYGVLRAHAAELTADGGPLAAFRRQSCRVILRDTRIYDSLLRRVAHPRFLRSGVDLSIELDVLKHLDLRSEERSWLWPAWEAEQRELQMLDVPLFRSSPDAALVGNGDLEIPDAFEEPGFEAAIARIAAFDDADLDRQVHFIRVALVSITLSAERSARRGPRRAGEEVPSDAELTADAAMEEARSIARGLEALAVDDDGGGMTWVGMVEKPRSARSELRDVGFDLYSGRAGVAIFFAALGRTTGDPRYRDAALRALGPLANPTRRNGGREVVAALDIGGGSGIGGIIYALVRVAQLTDSPALLHAARVFAAEISSVRLGNEGDFDLLGGSAGALLGLLTLYAAAPDRGVLESAALCGRHVLDGRVTDASSGLRAWSTGDRLLTGFGHGAAGIGYALDRLHHVTRCEHFASAARDAHRFVDGSFVEARGNWLEDGGAGQAPDLERLWCSWCHGAAGIGLGRVGSLDMALASGSRRYIDAALATAETRDYPSADHLCCGTMGRADLLCEAALRLDRPALLAAARVKAGGVVRRAQRRDAYATGFDCEYAPTFFQGLAGIGYELLRLAHPVQLSSVLLWQ